MDGITTQCLHATYRDGEMQPKLLLCPILCLMPLASIAEDVTLTWKPSPQESVDGYRVHYGIDPEDYTWSLDAGSANSATVTNLEPGETYYFTVSSYDLDGNMESDFSNEVSLTINSQTGEATLQWRDSTDADVNGYKLYYGLQPGNYTWNVDVGDNTSSSISGLEPGQTYFFAVTSYDSTDGRESAYSNEVSITIPSL